MNAYTYIKWFYDRTIISSPTWKVLVYCVLETSTLCSVSLKKMCRNLFKMPLLYLKYSDTKKSARIRSAKCGTHTRRINTRKGVLLCKIFIKRFSRRGRQKSGRIVEQNKYAITTEKIHHANRHSNSA